MEATQQEWEAGQRERWTIEHGIEKLEAQLPAIKRLQQQLAADKAVMKTQVNHGKHRSEIERRIEF